MIDLLLLLMAPHFVRSLRETNGLPITQRNMIRRSIVSGIVSTIASSTIISQVKAAQTACPCTCRGKIGSVCTCSSSTILCPNCGINKNNFQYTTNTNVNSGYDNSWYNPINERIYDVNKKSFLPVSHLDVLDKELNGRKIICIGEVHSNPCHHRVEYEIIRHLARNRDPKYIQIGLECFYRQHQRALDAFVFAHKNFGILKRDTRWDDTWGFDLNNYAKIFNFACQHGIRLVGLNVPYPVVKLVSSYGIENLPLELSNLLPKIDVSNKDHRKQFFNLIGAHGQSNSNDAMDRMYQAQCLWDDYMADSCVKALNKEPDSLFIVIAGVGHVLGRVGIPDRISKRSKQVPFVIVPQQVAWSLESGLPDVDHPLSRRDCDWAWYTEREMLNM